MAILPDLTAAFDAIPAPKAKAELEWVKLDVEKLDPEIKQLYLQLKAAEAAAYELKRKLTAAMSLRVSLPKGKILRISTRYNLSVAVEDDQRTVKSSSALSLESLAKQIANTHNQSLKIAK